MLHALVVLVMATLLAGCATIEHKAVAQQELDRPSIAGVGDVVLHVNKQRDLENAFGKADVFGRKTNEGFSELRFAGVEKTGEIVLYRKDVQIISNETTMSRSPFTTSTGVANTNASGTYSGNRYGGTANASATTVATATTIAPTSDFHVVVPAETVPIRLAPGESKVPMEGYVVEILRATPTSLEYKVTKY